MAALGLPLPPELDARDAPNGVETERLGDVAVIRFPVLNGAMSVARSRALAGAIRDARDAKVILLTGGPEFWCNGIDLATIEAADSPAEESLAAIEAIDDVCLALLETTGSWTMAAMAGNAGAGGVFMALAADAVVARAGTVLSPHYKNMGNLYGSEYWTYTLPRRLGAEGAARLMETRMPILAPGGEDRAGGRGPRRHAGDVRGRDDRAGRGAGRIGGAGQDAGGQACGPGGG
jgi:putative two-component system hydrogenase maturation factor HypX/HoxX